MSLTIPTRETIYQALVALLPRGRAWQTHDASIDRTESVMLSFWYAIAGVVEAAEQAIASTYDEFFCSTAVDDFDLWKEDYGIPDACDPFGENVCLKASTLGGDKVTYYEALALAQNWVTSMTWQAPGTYATLHIVINQAASDALVEEARAGSAASGVSRLGAHDIANLICRFERIIPAHCAITYEVI